MDILNPHLNYVDYKIVDSNKKHISKITKIADEELGKSYLDINSFKFGKSCFLRVAKQKNETVLGFCISSITSKLIMELQLGLKLTSKNSTSTIGLIKTLAVNKEYQNIGIGFNLVADAITNFKKQQIKTIICLAWKSKNGVNIAGIMQQHQFKILKEIPNYWEKESIKHKFNCPECGYPCNCSALIYLKN